MVRAFSFNSVTAQQRARPPGFDVQASFVVLPRVSSNGVRDAHSGYWPDSALRKTAAADR